MKKQVLKLNEEQLRQIIYESVKKQLSESEMDEGFLDNIKSAVKGAVSGYRAQNKLDKDIDNDYTKNTRQSPWETEDNDALEQVRELYELAKEYHTKANRLRNKANAIAKQYGIRYNGKGFDKSFNYDVSKEFKEKKPDIRGRHDNYQGNEVKKGNNFKQGIGKW